MCQKPAPAPCCWQRCHPDEVPGRRLASGLFQCVAGMRHGRPPMRLTVPPRRFGRRRVPCTRNVRASHVRWQPAGDDFEKLRHSVAGSAHKASRATTSSVLVARPGAARAGTLPGKSFRRGGGWIRPSVPSAPREQCLRRSQYLFLAGRPERPSRLRPTADDFEAEDQVGIPCQLAQHGDAAGIGGDSGRRSWQLLPRPRRAGTASGFLGGGLRG